MRKFKTLIICLFSFTLLQSCSKENSTITESVEVPSKENTTPIIELTYPYNDLVLDSNVTEFILQWKGSDADNDSLTFDVYFGETLPTTTNISKLKTQQYKVGNLLDGKIYKWKVVTSDGKTSAESEIRTFKVKEKTRGVIVEWPNVGAAYDIYFGVSSANEKIASNIKETSYIFKNLVVGNKYYYKIVPKGSNTVFEERYFYYKEEGIKIYNGNITLNNQESINEFGNKKYTQVTGTITIKQNYQANIDNLVPLSSLEIVGSLDLSYIYNLKSLYGLHNIRFIYGYLSIFNLTDLEKIELNDLFYLDSLYVYGNNSLVKLSLNNIGSLSELIIGGKVTMIMTSKYEFATTSKYNYGNPILEDVSFNSLSSVFGTVSLYKNESITNLNFLNNLKSIYEDLIIWNNDALEDISALSKLKEVGKSLGIYGNDKLKTLNGLENITIVPWYCLIYYNLNLEQLNLNSLETIGQFQLAYNDKLQKLDGLGSVREVALDFAIYKNKILDNYCDLWGLFKYGKIGGSTYISNNYYNPSIYGILNGSCN